MLKKGSIRKKGKAKKTQKLLRKLENFQTVETRTKITPQMPKAKFRELTIYKENSEFRNSPKC